MTVKTLKKLNSQATATLPTVQGVRSVHALLSYLAICADEMMGADNHLCDKLSQFETHLL